MAIVETKHIADNISEIIEIQVNMLPNISSPDRYAFFDKKSKSQ